MSKQKPLDKKQQFHDLTPPSLTRTIEAFSNAPVHTLLHQLDPSGDLEQCRRLKKELFACAATWQHLTLLEAAMRAACAIIELEGKEACTRRFHELHDAFSPTVDAPAMANILARYILNDPLLLLDDKHPFDIEQELGLLASTVTLIAAFITRQKLPSLATLDRERAEEILQIAEVRVPNWPGRITRLVDEYERTTYKAKNVTGTSST